ncbi:hypothetical protein LUQ84_003120 [Hamiltosporidium tvaerminnensis]|nr:hypothetical protein LUQ84_003120 [Hamiltosporidium tvaerminnensis]
MDFINDETAEIICREDKKEIINEAFIKLSSNSLSRSPEIDNNGTLHICMLFERMRKIINRSTNTNLKLRQLAVSILYTKRSELLDVLKSVNIEANDVNMEPRSGSLSDNHING